MCWLVAVVVEMVDLVKGRPSLSFSDVNFASLIHHYFDSKFCPCLDGIHRLYPIRPPEIGS